MCGIWSLTTHPKWFLRAGGLNLAHFSASMPTFLHFSASQNLNNCAILSKYMTLESYIGLTIWWKTAFPFKLTTYRYEI